MKFRIIEETSKAGNISYTPQIRKSLFVWKDIDNSGFCISKLGLKIKCYSLEEAYARIEKCKKRIESKEKEKIVKRKVLKYKS